MLLALKLLSIEKNKLSEDTKEFILNLEKVKEKNKFYEVNNEELKQDFSRYIINSQKEINS